MDIAATSANEAKKILSQKYSIKPEYILKAVDYKDIEKRNQEKFGSLGK